MHGLLGSEGFRFQAVTSLVVPLFRFTCGRGGMGFFVKKSYHCKKKSYLCNGKVNKGFAKVKGCSSAIPRNDSAAAGLAGEMSKRKCD